MTDIRCGACPAKCWIWERKRGTAIAIATLSSHTGRPDRGKSGLAKYDNTHHPPSVTLRVFLVVLFYIFKRLGSTHFCFSLIDFHQLDIGRDCMFSLH